MYAQYQQNVKKQQFWHLTKKYCVAQILSEINTLTSYRHHMCWLVIPICISWGSSLITPVVSADEWSFQKALHLVFSLAHLKTCFIQVRNKQKSNSPKPSWFALVQKNLQSSWEDLKRCRLHSPLSRASPDLSGVPSEILLMGPSYLTCEPCKPFGVASQSHPTPPCILLQPSLHLNSLRISRATKSRMMY